MSATSLRTALHPCSFTGVRIVERLAVALLMAACSACSTLSLDAAKTLATTGKDASDKVHIAAFASQSEFSRAMDAEALFHGMTNTEDAAAYKLIQQRFEKVQLELTNRAVVLSALTDFYDAFGDLATFDAQGETQKALQSLGGAVNGYRASVIGAGPLPTSTIGAVSAVGGIFASEAQKSAVKQASASVRPMIEAFRTALDDKLVREQFIGFKRVLAEDRKTAIVFLWDAGLFDTKPLITDAGSDAGLTATSQADQLVLKDAAIRNGLGAIIRRRLSVNIDALDRSYDTSVKILGRLVVEHQKLEDGAPLDIARLRELIAQLQGIVNLLTKSSSVNPS